MLRTRLQFADLEKLKGVDTGPAWEKSDKFIEQLEGGSNARRAGDLGPRRGRITRRTPRAVAAVSFVAELKPRSPAARSGARPKIVWCRSRALVHKVTSAGRRAWTSYAVMI